MNQGVEDEETWQNQPRDAEDDERQRRDPSQTNGAGPRRLEHETGDDGERAGGHLGDEQKHEPMQRSRIRFLIRKDIEDAHRRQTRQEEDADAAGGQHEASPIVETAHDRYIGDWRISCIPLYPEMVASTKPGKLTAHTSAAG